MSYTHLSEGQRYEISTLKKNGFKQIEIAKQLCINASTVSRELRRNTGQRGYRPKQAHQKALLRRELSAKAIKITPKMIKQVAKFLAIQWSPDQISNHMKNKMDMQISHESIYQIILKDKNSGGELYKQRRHSGKKRKKRYGAIDRRGEIKDRVSINERPAIIENRERIGDWEIDLIIGKNHQFAVVTIVDRLSLLTLIGKVSSKHAVNVTEVTKRLLRRYKKTAAKSITSDNGKEFAGHKEISKALGVDFYFANPYCSWERGVNENTNGLIRQYLPKGSDFTDVDDATCRFIMNRLNNRPRKSLGYQSPKKFFEERLCG